MSAGAKEILCAVQPLNLPHYPDMGHTTAVSGAVQSRTSHLKGQSATTNGFRSPSCLSEYLDQMISPKTLCLFARKPQSLSQLHYVIGTYLSTHIKNIWFLSSNQSLNKSLQVKYHINELACYVQIFWLTPVTQAKKLQQPKDFQGWTTLKTSADMQCPLHFLGEL